MVREWVGVLFFCTVTICEDLPWYKTAVIYQVFPLSFKDSDGNGIGDINGITESLNYIKDAGATAVYLNPIYKSPMQDSGYDISDYKDISPLFGTMDDYLTLVSAIKELGLKLIMDFVPNHTSDEHEWFLKSVMEEDPYTDYYVWRDGVIDPDTNETRPPNHWESKSSGPAWTWNDERQQYYYHLFEVKQPDLNMRNPNVVQELDDVLRFWMSLGTDGFRVDATIALFEDELFSEGIENQINFNNDKENSAMTNHFAEVIYNYSLSDGVQRTLLPEGYGGFGGGGSGVNISMRYYNKEFDFMQPMNFDLRQVSGKKSRPQDYKDLIDAWMDSRPSEIAMVWAFGKHDWNRTATEFSPEMGDVMNLLSCVLPGSRLVYMGEEINMEDTYLRYDQTIDNRGILLGPDRYIASSRDPVRTPMQWDDSPSAGFSSNWTTWLPVNPNYWRLNVAAQQAAETSHLKVFQGVASARQDPVLARGDLRVLVPDENTLVVIRSYEESFFVLVINMGSYVAEYTSESLFAPLGLDTDMTVEVASMNAHDHEGLTFVQGSAKVTLRPQAAVLLRAQ